MASVVYLLDPKTQNSYALEEFEDSYDALDQKDVLRARYPDNIFYYTVNGPLPESFYSIEEALQIVNGE